MIFRENIPSSVRLVGLLHVKMIYNINHSSSIESCDEGSPNVAGEYGIYIVPEAKILNTRITSSKISISIKYRFFFEIVSAEKIMPLQRNLIIFE